jgi:hypothetical protein
LTWFRDRLYRSNAFRGNSLAEGNSSWTDGGVLLMFGSSPAEPGADNGSALIEACLFEGNSSMFNGGSVIKQFNNVTLTIDRSIFRDNGDGFSTIGVNWRDAVTHVMNTIFDSNDSHVWSNTMGDVTFTNCTVVGNGTQWGPVFDKTDANDGNMPYTGTYVITNSIISGNSEPVFMHDADNTVIVHSIVHGNTLCWGGLACPGVTTDAVIDADPLFAGWSEEGLGLAPQSPAVDAGDTSMLADSMTTDLAGNPRVRDIAAVPGTGVDIGAFELTPVCPADYDASGFLDTDDYDVFASVFESGDPAADFDSTGFVDTDDFDAFVQAFEAGC